MRRRKKNSLLPKMIGIAVIVNAILLPILARFGVFKGVHGQHLEQIKLVTLPPPRKRPAQKRAAPKHPTPHPHTAARSTAHTQTARESRPSPNQPKVVAAAGGTGGGGATIDNNGTGTPGTLPPSPPVAPPPPTPVAPTPTPPPPTPTPPPPTPAPAPAPPHVPILVEATPINQPRPKIPDDLSYDDIHGNFEALFTVSATGGVSVQMVSSTGNTTLDTLALDTAREWTFRPATVDGKPVDSYRRLSIEFYAA